MFILNDELGQLFKGLERGRYGEIKHTVQRLSGYAAGPQSQVDVATRSKAHAEKLARAAVNAKEQGRLLEGKILQNQSDYELAFIAQEMASRSLHYMKGEQAQEAQQRAAAYADEMDRLKDDALALDTKFKEQRASELGSRAREPQRSDPRRDTAPQFAEQKQRDEKRELAEVRARIAKQSENRFVVDKVAERLKEAKQQGAKLTIDDIEKLDTRLGRTDEGALSRKYLENSSTRSGRRNDMREYVEELRKEAREWDRGGNDVLAQRYEAQADMEAAVSQQREAQLADRDDPRVRAANEKLALADLSGRGQHLESAAERLEANTSRPRSEWVRDLYNTSELRANLDVSAQDAYDRRRDITSKSMAERRGVEAEGYKMTEREAASFDKAFVGYVAETKRTQEQHRQRMMEQSRADEPGRGRDATRETPERRPEKVQVRAPDTRDLARKDAATRDNQPAQREGDDQKREQLEKQLLNPERLSAEEKKTVERESGKPVPRDVDGHKPVQSKDLAEVKYLREKDQAHTMTDRGSAVRVEKAHVHDMGAIKAGLTLANEKYENINVRSKDDQFKAMSARAAVELGFESKFKQPEMASLIEKAREDVARERQQVEKAPQEPQRAERAHEEQREEVEDQDRSEQQPQSRVEQLPEPAVDESRDERGVEKAPQHAEPTAPAHDQDGPACGYGAEQIREERAPAAQAEMPREDDRRGAWGYAEPVANEATPEPTQAPRDEPAREKAELEQVEPSPTERPEQSVQRDEPSRDNQVREEATQEPKAQQVAEREEATPAPEQESAPEAQEVEAEPAQQPSAPSMPRAERPWAAQAAEARGRETRVAETPAPTRSPQEEEYDR